MIPIKKTKSLFMRLVALCLVFAFAAPIGVNAATAEIITPRASYYLDAYNTYICDMGSGRIEIWFDVMGTGDMDEIGVLAIELYEVNSDGSLTWIKTFLHDFPYLEKVI